MPHATSIEDRQGYGIESIPAELRREASANYAALIREGYPPAAIRYLRGPAGWEVRGDRGEPGSVTSATIRPIGPRGEQTAERPSTVVTLEISEADARAIACVRRPDVALDEVEPAGAQEIREHLEGVLEGIREEVDPDA